MTILDEIIENKIYEIILRKQRVSSAELKESLYYKRETYSLKNKLMNAPGIISEFKRRSPSKGIIKEHANVRAITKSYELAGASACSILTDEKYFGGKDQDIIDTRSVLFIPILRKEFIIDPYQIIEAKSIGADLILLIAECLSKIQVMEYTQRAHDIGLEVLMELHFPEELEKWNPGVDLLGINNRNLKSFETGIHRSMDIAGILPKESLWISESGLQGSEELEALMKVGYRGFLIGETFMRSEDPGALCHQFVMNLKNTIVNGI
ncbi:MAG: indole-3-glycerol phosphate synthase TrpC [Saprospiraceae bacterium]